MGVSIKELTDAADVGFGSFYNHFNSKEELMAAAVEAALDDWASLADAAASDVDDPAEYIATGFRMTGRLQRANPELVRVLLRSGTSILSRDRGLRSRAIEGLRAGVEAGRFTRLDPDITVMVLGGALLGLLQLLEDRPDDNGNAFSDTAAERVLVMLGINQSEAEKLAHTALPALPDLLPEI
nr:TetR family transcriptional regulator [Brevibacterium sp. 'Marine']